MMFRSGSGSFHDSKCLVMCLFTLLLFAQITSVDPLPFPIFNSQSNPVSFTAPTFVNGEFLTTERHLSAIIRCGLQTYRKYFEFLKKSPVFSLPSPLHQLQQPNLKSFLCSLFVLHARFSDDHFQGY